MSKVRTQTDKASILETDTIQSIAPNDRASMFNRLWIYPCKALSAGKLTDNTDTIYVGERGDGADVTPDPLFADAMTSAGTGPMKIELPDGEKKMLRDVIIQGTAGDGVWFKWWALAFLLSFLAFGSIAQDRGNRAGSASGGSTNGITKAEGDARYVRLSGTDTFTVSNLLVTGEITGYTNQIESYSVYAAGSPAFINASSVGTMDFGTTDPSVLVSNAGTYCVFSKVTVLRSVDSAPDDLGTGHSLQFSVMVSGSPIDTSAYFIGWETNLTIPQCSVSFLLPTKIVSLTNNATLSIQGTMTADFAAGSISATAAEIVAVKLK